MSDALPTDAPQSAALAPAATPLLRSLRPICVALFLVTLLHLILMRTVFNVSMATTADAMMSQTWQFPGVAEMRHLPFQSIWYWHAYPSGFVAYWVVLANVFGPHGCATACAWIYLVASAGLPAMTYVIGLALCRNRAAALVGAVVLGASPTLPMFASYFVYDTPTMVLVTAAAACIALYELTDRPTGWLVAGLYCVGGLVFIRAMYHLLVLVPLAVAIVRARPGWRTLAVAGGTIVPGLAMYSKNLLLFGFFGASSMLGLNYSKMVVWPLSSEALVYHRDAGRLTPLVADYPVFYPLIYGKWIYEAYGFTAIGPNDVLNGNDANNINMIAIAQEYGRCARSVLLNDPAPFLKALSYSGWIFCSPPSRSDWFIRSPARIEPYRSLYLNVFYGEWIGPLLDRMTGSGRMPSLVMPLLPLLIGGFAVVQWRRCRFAWRSWWAAAIARPTLFAAIGTMVYTATLSCLLEVGENDRYFTYIEPLFVMTTVASAMWVGRQGFAARRVAGHTGHAV